MASPMKELAHLSAERQKLLTEIGALHSADEQMRRRDWFHRWLEQQFQYLTFLKPKVVWKTERNLKRLEKE